MLNIWCNTPFQATTQSAKEMLIEGASPHRLVLFEAEQNGADAAARDALLEADIAFGQPDAATAMRAEKLRWAHLNSAGYTPYDRDDFKGALRMRGAVMTNSSAVYDEPCAQHLLAMMLSLARGLPRALDEQRTNHDWQMTLIRERSRLLNEQIVLLLGFGSIARRLAELLAPLRMNIIGVRRRVRGDESVRMIAESVVDEYLPPADHIVNTLPANDSTTNFLNAARLSLIKPEAILYNIGRGTTLDQEALIGRLRRGQIAAAYLDVTDPEPLPPEHPLWTTPNCFITPHTAGGHANEKERQVQHFLENLRRFTRGQDLLNRII